MILIGEQDWAGPSTIACVAEYRHGTCKDRVHGDTSSANTPLSTVCQMLALYQSIRRTEIEPEATKLASQSGCYLHLLQTSRAVSEPVIQNNPFEALVPMIQIAAASTLDQLRLHTTNASLFLHGFREVEDSFTPEQFEIQLRQFSISMACMATIGRDLHVLLEDVKLMFGASNYFTQQHETIRDIAYVVTIYEKTFQLQQFQQTVAISMNSLVEAQHSRNQSQSVKRLTQVALVVLPLSLVTSAFGMNIDLLSDPGVKWWNVLIGSGIIYSALGFVLFCLHVESNKALRQTLNNKKQKIVGSMPAKMTIEQVKKCLSATGVRRRKTEENPCSCAGAQPTASPPPPPQPPV